MVPKVLVPARLGMYVPGVELLKDISFEKLPVVLLGEIGAYYFSN